MATVYNDNRASETPSEARSNGVLTGLIIALILIGGLIYLAMANRDDDETGGTTTTASPTPTRMTTPAATPTEGEEAPTQAATPTVQTPTTVPTVTVTLPAGQ